MSRASGDVTDSERREAILADLAGVFGAGLKQAISFKDN
jgi:hypothetical protein